MHNLFYGSFLQCTQTILGWKRIYGSDIANCYQQAAGLATMVLDEVERKLMAAYLHHVDTTPVLQKKFFEEKNPKNLSILIANGYLTWIDEKCTSTTDEVFRMMLNFVKTMTLCQQFRCSLSSGDSIMIEVLYQEFLPIFVLTNKKHYVEIVLGMIDTLCSKLNCMQLQLVRTNRTVSLYSSQEKQENKPMSNWALDAIIELIQKHYHQMRFKNEKG